MKSKSPFVADPTRRATLADVAKLAAVSLMTASYAMRNNPKISRPTRERVQRAARKVGYVPHPEIGRLMHLLRAKRMPSYQATLGFLSFSHDPQAATHPYTIGVIAGAKSRARTLGYAVDSFNVDSAKLSRTRLTTMLKSRGIRGVLIPPLPAIEDCSQLLDWSQFSIVAATYSAQNLIVNRVVPHHQNNIMQALAQLRELGFRRPGLVLTGDLVRRANFAYHATLALHQQLGDFAPIPVVNLSSDHLEQLAGTIEPWVQQHRPDVILTAENAVQVLRVLLGPRFGSRISVCLLDHSGTDALPGIHQHPKIIGETAVELLAGQVQRGEVGFEEHPRVTMVEGRWISGKTS
jgi:LacI family transcriptional regulator